MRENICLIVISLWLCWPRLFNLLQLDACLGVIPLEDLSEGPSSTTPTTSSTSTTTTTTTTTTVTACSDATPLFNSPPIFGSTQVILSSTLPTPVGSSITVQCISLSASIFTQCTAVAFVFNLIIIIPPIPPIPPGGIQDANNLGPAVGAPIFGNCNEQFTMTCRSDGNWDVSYCLGGPPPIPCIGLTGVVGQNIGGLGQMTCQAVPD